MLLERLPSDHDAADVLIVGGGAVGLTMAVALARSGRKVLVCESGQAALNTDWQSLNTVVQTGRVHVGSVEGRYRGLGGTTRLWGGQLMPFTQTDLAPNPARGKLGWPVDHAELNTYVDATLRLLGVADSWAETEAQWCSVTGQPLDLGPDLRLAPSLWLPQPDFSMLFAKELRASDNLRILVGHEVIGADCDTADGKVTGVKLRAPDGTLTTARAASTVLACGTLETSRLLLRMQAALSQSPLAANRHVGRWFFDHLHGVAGEVTPLDRDNFGRLFDSFYFQGRKLLPKVRLSDAVVAAERLPNCAGVFLGATSPGLIVQDIKGLARRILGGGVGGRGKAIADAVQVTRLIMPLVVRYLRENRTSNFLSNTARLGMEMELQPCADSYLALESGVPADQAKIAVNWAIDGSEIAGFARFATILRDYCAAVGLGRVELDPRLVAQDVGYFADCRDSNHQMGGARMAGSADDGVVDQHGQVFAMPGLFVAGAPTFSSGSFANPTLVAMALGQRLADHLTRSVK